MRDGRKCLVMMSALQMTACFLLISATVMVSNVGAESIQGVCAVTAGTVSGNKYATLKCYRADDPGNYTIRSTRWERDGKKEYRDLARFSGRRFKCKMSKGGNSLSGDAIFTNYQISDCR